MTVSAQAEISRPRIHEPVAMLDRVSKIYGSGDTEVRALDELSLTVIEGDYLAVIGASGSGKSTAMNIIGCLDRPTSGHYRLSGSAVEDLDDDELADLRNRKLGFVLQQFHLLAHMSAIDNVMLPMIYAGISADQRRQLGIEALERVGLGHRLQNKPNQLSGGQQQRVAIARALVNGPQLILADEPTGALDTHTSHDIMSLLADLNEQGMTVVLVTHERDIAAWAARRIVFRDGQVIEDVLQVAGRASP